MQAGTVLKGHPGPGLEKDRRAREKGRQRLGQELGRPQVVVVGDGPSLRRLWHPSQNKSCAWGDREGTSGDLEWKLGRLR